MNCAFSIKNFGLVCLLLVSQVSFGWGLTGHRIVGGLAQKHITNHARTEVSRVLSGYQLQDVSNWADEIKSDHSVFYKSLRQWHYMDLANEKQLDEQPTDQWPEDLHRALDFTISRLKKRVFTKDLTEEVLLRLLIHLVADAHQPLHVGNGQDRGGNTCYVRWFYSKWTMSLHSVWDSKLIDVYKLSYSEYVDYLNHIPPEMKKQWQKASVKDWLRESSRLHKQIYPQEKGVKISDYCVKSRSMVNFKKTPKLGYAYQNRVRPILNQRLAQAGVRLAGVINDIYDQ